MKRLTDRALARWGFATDPFAGRPRSYSEMFKPADGEHDRVIRAILGTIAAVEATAVVAPVMWGKSLCWMAVKSQIAADQGMGYMFTEVQCLDKSEVDAGNILRAILTDLDVAPRAGENYERLTREVVRTLKARSAKRKRIVLMIDDAQWLPQEGFRAIKGLLDVTDGFARVISVILMGQEELGTQLARETNRQLAGRMEIIKPGPFNIADGEVRAYIRHRVFCARQDPQRPRGPIDDAERDAVAIPFTEDGLAAIELECTAQADVAEESDTRVMVRPDPGVINAICAHALSLAHDIGSMEITADVVHQARARMLAGV